MLNIMLKVVYQMYTKIPTKTKCASFFKFGLPTKKHVSLPFISSLLDAVIYVKNKCYRCIKPITVFSNTYMQMSTSIFALNCR